MRARLTVGSVQHAPSGDPVACPAAPPLALMFPPAPGAPAAPPVPAAPAVPGAPAVPAAPPVPAVPAVPPLPSLGGMPPAPAFLLRPQPATTIAKSTHNRGSGFLPIRTRQLS